jgi:hypothetical protein
MIYFSYRGKDRKPAGICEDIVFQEGRAALAHSRVDPLLSRKGG